MKVTNTSKAPQGVWAKSGTVYIAPGETKDVDLSDDGLKRAKALPFLEVEEAKPAKAADK
ncbi:hypothetical protein FBZ98_1011032 [Rhizobium sp. ERR 922]|uniref:hypothetical protein n=1 Tax=unclassified Rhizobium TaxID=2613769 RepID=UPI0011A5DBFC|nr:MULTISPECIES: hypothetical protein [unclassified Rhizobium]TWB61687.1 hypothetical protein FBZ98_1011032 [Rhizobium sp. ERR 922]TWC04613.1 hypothetical protein FBZ97_1011032 [Rhizobium sp. ERR 942]